MFKPSLEEFKKLSKSGNLIPVYKEILADLDTPVSAYMKISDGEDYSFLLESVEGGEKWARYCFLGCDPAVVVSSKGRNITIEENGGGKEQKIESGNPLSAIKKILERYNPVDVPGLPRFSGGAVGFISYDMVRFFEDLPEKTEDDLNIPDSQFLITDTMLVFDNVSQTIKMVSNAYIDSEDITAVYERTVKKITLLEDKLKKPLKLLDGIEKHPSRLMFRVNDFGVAQVGAAKSEVQPESELAVYQNKSYIRNNLLFSQSLSISIPLNTTLRAGLMVEVKFPVKKEEGNEGAETYGSDKTNDASGKYLISNLRHLVGGGMGETQLELIRDVFTA